FDCSSLPGCQLLVSSVKSCWVEIICSMMMRVWCPQKVSVRPDGSRMVVVARSLGWASHTIMGASLVRGGALSVCTPGPVMGTGGCVLRRLPVLVVVLCRTG